jgi:hypothetical protein
MDNDPDNPDEERISRAELLKAAGAAAAGALGALLLSPGGAAEAFAGQASGTAAGTIVRCIISPGIGIARVGNAPGEYYIGPEVPGVTPNLTKRYKDESGRIKRQAARFRVYGLNAAGQVVRELVAGEAQITWTVHLANKKAAWYQFHYALDIPEARSAPPTLQAARRNAQIKGKARQELVIDPGPRSIAGMNVRGPAYHFDTGRFMGRRVSLGELRTDAYGHLLVLGGFGQSGTVNANTPPMHIANNDGWYDDTSDGPVTARVVLGGKSLPVTPAWVIVAPPAYAPGITPMVTLYDVAYQAWLDVHAPTQPPAVSFTRDILPIFERFDQLQWVNEGFSIGYGWKGQVPLRDPVMLTALAQHTSDSAQTRQTIFGRFRDPASPQIREDAWPRLYGDAFPKVTNSAVPTSPRHYMTVTREQYRRLGEWAAGRFDADWDPVDPRPQSLTDVPLSDRPAALDRAALGACSGGPFHPGEEAPWIMRHGSIYAGLCRLNPRSPGASAERDHGEVLTPGTALGAQGPLHAVSPGDVTRWMAVPWQTDTASCGAAYPNSTVQRPYPFPDLPSFWPALAPNRVLTAKAFQRLLQTELGDAARQQAFAERKSWTRHFPDEYADFLGRNRKFIKDWSLLGIVTQQLGPGDAAFPAVVHVETESGFAEDAVPQPQSPTPED